jgi:hypothetical protein
MQTRRCLLQDPLIYLIMQEVELRIGLTILPISILDSPDGAHNDHGSGLRLDDSLDFYFR